MVEAVCGFYPGIQFLGIKKNRMKYTSTKSVLIETPDGIYVTSEPGKKAGKAPKREWQNTKRTRVSKRVRIWLLKGALRVAKVLNYPWKIT